MANNSAGDSSPPLQGIRPAAYAKLGSKSVTGVNSRGSRSDPPYEAGNIIAPIYRWGNRCTQGLRSLPRAQQPGDLASEFMLLIFTSRAYAKGALGRLPGPFPTSLSIASPLPCALASTFVSCDLFSDHGLDRSRHWTQSGRFHIPSGDVEWAF